MGKIQEDRGIGKDFFNKWDYVQRIFTEEATTNRGKKKLQNGKTVASYSLDKGLKFIKNSKH